MHAVAVAAIPIGILASVLNDRPVLGLPFCLDTGLMLTLAVLFAFTPHAVTRGHSRPFVAGFVAAFWAAAIAYVACCALFPDVVSHPVVYYVNEIEPRLFDADTLLFYSISLTARGVIMAVPQLLIALAGGFVATLVARRKAGE